jgi:hypothetical protein
MRERYPPLEQPPWKAYTYITALKREVDYLRKKLDAALVLYLDTEIYGPVLLLEEQDNYYCCPHCHRIECRLGLAVTN